MWYNSVSESKVLAKLKNKIKKKNLHNFCRQKNVQKKYVRLEVCVPKKICWKSCVKNYLTKLSESNKIKQTAVGHHSEICENKLWCIVVNLLWQWTVG